MKKVINKNKLVSIVIPTRNSANILENCLKSIKNQSYPYIEIIIVDARSTDNVEELAKKYKCRFLNYKTKLNKVFFDAPHKINYGSKNAYGEYLYWVDADMELTRHVIKECVDLCQKGAGAVIVPEDSFGIGIWAEAKKLERRCYWGDDNIESPRFLVKKVWDEIGGFDLSLGAGANDWDLHMKVKDSGYKVSRAKSLVMHNEGELTLKKLFRKRFMYGREVVKYIEKRPKAGIVSFFPIRYAYIKNWRSFVKKPVITIAFITMRTVEYGAGFLGIVSNRLGRK
jgi:glycosyltransferase involved in cell wall biosynthesis